MGCSRRADLTETVARNMKLCPPLQRPNQAPSFFGPGLRNSLPERERPSTLRK